MFMKFSIAKCKTKAAFKAKLDKKLNLEKIKEKFNVKLETPILLVIEEKGIEVIVHKYGELMFKKTSDMNLMEEIAKKVYFTG